MNKTKENVISFFVIAITVFFVLVFICDTGKTQPAVIKKAISLVTHPKFIAVLDYISSYAHIIYDANTDAITWHTLYGGGNLYNGNINLGNWHYHKNMARLWLVIKGYCIGTSIVHVYQGKLDWKRLYRREIRILPALMTTWRMRYTYNRYGKIWDTSAEHNETRYVIPLPGNDIKIPLSGWQVSLANITELSISSYYLIKDINGGTW